MFKTAAPGCRLVSQLLTSVAVIALSVGEASATSISNDRTNPVNTSTVNGGAADDITITSSGSVTTATGPSVVIDSSNSVTNNGTIATSTNTGGTGVQIWSGNSGSFTNGGAIDLLFLDSNDMAAGADNIGIEVTGTGTFTGDITIEDDSSVKVGGDNSIGILIDAAMTGDLTIAGTVYTTATGVTSIWVDDAITGNFYLEDTGTITATGEGAIAIRIEDVISGRLWLNGTVVANGAEAGSDLDPDDDVIPQATAGVAIGASLGGGFQLGGIIDESDANEDATIYTYYSDYAVLISQTIASTPGNITLSAPGGTGGDYGFTNLGSINAYTGDEGEDVTSVRIEGAGGYTTTIEGGLYNAGTISGSATEATAYGLSFGSGAITPAIVNEGTLRASASGDSTATAYALRLEAGASVTSLTNTETIYAAATAEYANAYAILDESGSLTTITNNGSIKAAVFENEDGELDDNAATVAIDLSANTTGTTVTNAEDITGDVFLGSGNDSFSLVARYDDDDDDDDDDGKTDVSTMTGVIDFGAGDDDLIIEGGGTFTGGTLKSGGTLDIALNDGEITVVDDAELAGSTMTVAGASILTVEVGADADPLAARADLANSLTFETGTSLVLKMTEYVGLTAQYILAEAPTIDIADGLDTLTASEQPYLYNATFALTPGTVDQISVTLELKTADEMGLSEQQARLYDAVLEMLSAEDSGLDEILAPISDRKEFLAAYDQLLPDTSLATTRSSLAALDARSSALGDRRTMINLKARRAVKNNTGWVQVFGGALSTDTTVTSQGLDGTYYGMIAGADTKLFGLFPVGGYLMTIGSESDHADMSDEDIRHTGLSAGAYSAFEWGPAFLQFAAGYSLNNYDSTRVFNSGSTDVDIDSNWSGSGYDAEARAGFEAKFGALVITPSLAYAFLHTEEDERTEEGGGEGLDLVYLPYEADIQRTSAELAVGWEKMLKTDVVFRPEVFAAYREILDGAEQTVSARFVGGTEVFELPATLPENTIAGGLTLGVYGRGAELKAQYEFETGDGDTTHTGALKMVMRF
ncbi:MAG: autotransporter domain-containing protein [Alphaproteobacteria bacterium]|nr:autotransporter domain-containing protein [Alphaproteobacteria bacterium]